MDTSVTFGPIGQIARTVQNIEKAQRWYYKVLGLAHLYTFEDPEGRLLAPMSQVKAVANAAGG